MTTKDATGGPWSAQLRRRVQHYHRHRCDYGRRGVAPLGNCQAPFDLPSVWEAGTTPACAGRTLVDQEVWLGASAANRVVAHSATVVLPRAGSSQVNTNLDQGGLSTMA